MTDLDKQVNKVAAMYKEIKRLNSLVEMFREEAGITKTMYAASLNRNDGLEAENQKLKAIYEAARKGIGAPIAHHLSQNLFQAIKDYEETNGQN